LRPSTAPSEQNAQFNFSQNICYDTTRIRTELGYRELIPEYEAVLQTLRSQPN